MPPQGGCPPCTAEGAAPGGFAAGTIEDINRKLKGKQGWYTIGLAGYRLHGAFCGSCSDIHFIKTHLLRWAAGPDTMTEPGEQTAGTRIHAQKRAFFLQPRSKAERKKHPYRNGTDANCFTVPRLSPDDRFFGRERGSKGRPGNRAAAHSLQTFSGRPASQASRL